MTSTKFAIKWGHAYFTGRIEPSLCGNTAIIYGRKKEAKTYASEKEALKAKEQFSCGVGRVVEI